MRHVDCLSRNPVQKITDFYTDNIADKSMIVKGITHLDMDDWVVIAQTQDPGCQEIRSALHLSLIHISEPTRPY